MFVLRGAVPSIAFMVLPSNVLVWYIGQLHCSHAAAVAPSCSCRLAHRGGWRAPACVGSPVWDGCQVSLGGACRQGYHKRTTIQDQPAQPTTRASAGQACTRRGLPTQPSAQFTVDDLAVAIKVRAVAGAVKGLLKRVPLRGNSRRREQKSGAVKRQAGQADRQGRAGRQQCRGRRQGKRELPAS